MGTSVLGSQLESIRDGLAERPNLVDVSIFTGVVSVEEAGEECVAFGGECRLDEVVIAMGGNREETWTVSGEIRIIKAWQGDTELTITAARDRVLELFAEVETYLNDTYTGSMPDVNIERAELFSNIVAEGRECRLPFELSIRAHKNP